MKARIWLVFAALGTAVASQGCSLKPQNLRLDPIVKVQPSQVGNGMTVGLGVSDMRPTKRLGEVGDPDTKLVEVSVEEDPSPAIFNRVKDALSQLGFTVTPYSEGMDRSLQLEIRQLELQSLKKPLTFDTELRAEVAAHVVNGNDFYDRQFNVRTRKEGAAPPFEKDSTALVNTAVSQALEDMLSDDQLLGMLAR